MHFPKILTAPKKKLFEFFYFPAASKFQTIQKGDLLNILKDLESLIVRKNTHSCDPCLL